MEAARSDAARLQCHHLIFLHRLYSVKFTGDILGEDTTSASTDHPLVEC